jgi:hypothetical protein
MQVSIDEIVNSDRPVVRRTASSLLAKFLPNKSTEHKMAASGPALRAKPRVSYAVSDSSASSESPSQDFVDLAADESEDDDEDDEIQYEKRKRPAGRALRPQKSVGPSLQVNFLDKASRSTNRISAIGIRNQNFNGTSCQRPNSRPSRNR